MATKRNVKKAARPQKKAAARPVKRTQAKAVRPKTRKTATSAKPKPKPKPRAKTKAAAKPIKKAAAPTRKPVRKAAPKPAAGRKVMARKAPARKPAAAAKPVAKPKAAPKAKAVVPPPPATLQRERRRLPEAEAENEEAGPFNDATQDSRLMSSARAGHDELRSEIKQHTEASPALTAGDVDAKWQDAYALGDEAPGGDNMTPDQDRVDDIGKALGIEYADDEELLGGDELAERDEHRWELDPASKEDDDEI